MPPLWKESKSYQDDVLIDISKIVEDFKVKELLEITINGKYEYKYDVESNEEYIFWNAEPIIWYDKKKYIYIWDYVISNGLNYLDDFLENVIKSVEKKILEELRNE